MEQLFYTEGQKKSQRRQIERRMKVNDMVAMFLGIFGLALSFYENELFYGKLDFQTDDGGSITGFTVEEEQYNETATNTALRLLIGLSSLILVGLVFNHYRLYLKLLKTKQKVDNYDTLKSSGLLLPMIIEMVYCIIHCPPGFNWVFNLEQHGGELEYSLDALIFIIMLGRIYLIWRIFTNYSTWNDERAEEICHSCLCEGGVNFAIKAELKERPYIVVTCVLLLSIFVFGVALRCAERPFKFHSGQDWDYVWNGMWCIIITMTTVGFGDFYPSTHLGRFIGVLACFWGTFLVSLMVVSLTISSEFTPQERKAYDKIKRDEAEDQIRIKAANAIKFAIRLRIFLRKNAYASDRQKARYTNQFKAALIEYRAHKRNLIASEQDAPIEYILAKLNDKVAFGLDRIKNDCHVYKTLLARLDNAELNQKKLQDDIDNLTNLNSMIQEKLEIVKKKKNQVEPRTAFQ